MNNQLSSLVRPSGGFAMVAVDQREAMRAMFAGRQHEPVTDARLTGFKLAATRALSPHASGVLLDRQFVLDAAIESGAVFPACGLIAAADRFLPGVDELVGDTEIDEQVDPAAYARRGVAAMKLLVIYRPDQPSATRIAMVERFVERCHRAGLVSIIEPVSRPPLGGGEWDWGEGVLRAAQELGSRGADLYKAEVPSRGEGHADAIRRRCAAITTAVDSPWVVLSSGVAPDAFPAAVRLACSEGASGFLAGRAIWQSVIGAADEQEDLERVAVPRLRALSQLVDDCVATGVRG